MGRFQNTRQPDWGWWGKLWPTPGETLRELGLSTGDSVAEIGCGNGYFALPAARVVAPAPVYALDLDASLLAELERLSELHGIDNIYPLEGDARFLTRQLPEPVDVALIANTFHGIDDSEGFVRTVAEALSEDGRFVVVNWLPLPRETTTVDGEPRGPPTDLRRSSAETQAVVEAASELRLTAERALPPYHYGLVFQPRESSKPL